MLSCHIVHKEGEHLAPHRVLASWTGLGTEEGEIITEPSQTEQDTGTLCSHSGCWVPLGACSVSAQDQTHTCDSVVEVQGPGSHTPRQGELCQEVLQGLKIIPALALIWGGGRAVTGLLLLD